jgi:hypothetical protein
MKRIRTIGDVSLSAIENQWQARATAAALKSARGVVYAGGPIPPRTPVGQLGDTEWGWIITAILFAWIGTRAEQAAAENLDTDRTIRMVAVDPQPWDAGAVAAILPELADACPDIDWSLPLATWPRDTMVEFLLAAMRLIRKAMIARDISESGITRKSNASLIAREANAASGGPLMTPQEWVEWNDDVGL